MHVQRLEIPGTMPGLNEMLAARGKTRLVHSKARGQSVQISMYSSLKKAWGQTITLYCKAQGIQPVQRARFRFIWRELNKRRDPDNIASAKKLILDGLVTAQVIENDGWKEVAGWEDVFTVDKHKQGVTVEIITEAEA